MKLSIFRGAILLRYADQCFGDGIEMLLPRSRHRILSRRLLPDWTGRSRTAYRLRKSDGRVPRFLGLGWERSCHAHAGMGISWTEAGRPLVRLRHALEICARSRPGRTDRSRSNTLERARICHAGRITSACFQRLKSVSLRLLALRFLLDLRTLTVFVIDRLIV